MAKEGGGRSVWEKESGRRGQEEAVKRRKNSEAGGERLNG